MKNLNKQLNSGLGLSKTEPIELVSDSIEDTRAIARELAKQVKPGLIIFFQGDLGCGKTTFIKSLISYCTGIDEDEITSPTFTYVNPYQDTNDNYSIYHFDLYRLNEGEFEAMGFEDLILEKNAICCMEWPEKLFGYPIQPNIIINLAHNSPHSRIIQIEIKNV